MTSYPQQPTPGYTPPQTNGLGLAGFITSLVGMVVCLGVPCPIGVLLSFIAIFRAPRGFAIAGLVLGVLGTLLWTLLILMAIGTIGSGLAIFSGWQSIVMNQGLMESAAMDIDHHYNQNQQQLPDDAAGTTIVATHLDYWGTPFEYRLVDASNFEIHSAGEDLAMGTQDDLVVPYLAGMTAAGWGQMSMSESAAAALPDGTGGFAEANQAIDQTYGGSADSPSQIVIQPMLDHANMDQWGNQILYRAGVGPTYHLNSAGPDGVHGNGDDVIRRYTLDQLGEIPELDNP